MTLLANGSSESSDEVCFGPGAQAGWSTGNNRGLASTSLEAGVDESLLTGLGAGAGADWTLLSCEIIWKLRKTMVEGSGKRGGC